MVPLRHGIGRSEMARDHGTSWVAATWSATHCGHACCVWRRVSESGLAIFFCDGYGRRHADDEVLRVSDLFSFCGCGPSCRLFSDGYPRRCSRSSLDAVCDLWLRVRRSRPFYEISRFCPHAKQTCCRQCVDFNRFGVVQSIKLCMHSRHAEVSAVKLDVASGRRAERFPATSERRLGIFFSADADRLQK
jgi:hypothetical protein